MKPYILCVDDEIDNVDALERIFRKKYEVLKSTSGEEALQILKTNPDIAILISDQRMPGMQGVDFLKKSMITHPNSIRILLTGYTDIESIIDSINSGQVYKYLTKPWDPVDLLNTIDKAYEKYSLRKELEIKNKDLKMALDELKVLDQAKSKFMILINHELKTPLTVISSFLELLQESSLNQEQSMYTKHIEKSYNRLKQLTDDVLELVEAESGMVKINKSKKSLKDLPQKIKNSFNDQLSKKSQELKFKGTDLNCNLDHDILSKVLFKIVDNAIKFGDKNSEITINAIQESKSKTKFSVENKGKPLDQKTIDSILKPFNIDENILNHSEGLGLGLSLTQALLKSHESQLNFSSEKNTVSVSFVL